MVESTGATGPDRRARRRPLQERSRRRFEQVLDAAGALIAERGLDPVTMTDIADSAGMALTAVYRYFPSKGAVLRELALRMLDSDADLTAGFARIRAHAPERWVPDAIERYCRQHLGDRLRLQVKAAIHADAELSALDLADSRRNAATIAEALARAGARVPTGDLEIRALIFVETVDSVIRLAARAESEQADEIIRQFARSASRMLLGDGPDDAGAPIGRPPRPPVS